MAKINIKTNFVDGEKLFAQQLNNNFKAIQEGMNSDNKIIWQDGEEVLFKRYVTNDIESLPILDGSIIYDVEKGRHYIDYNGNRIQVGSSGKEVLVQDNEPTEEDNKLWIDSDFVNTMGTEVVDSLDGDETNMAPSVRAVNKKINEVIESGSNERGSWIKYSNGTLICYGEFEKFCNTWTTANSIYECAVENPLTFPFEFIERPMSVQLANTGDQDKYRACWIQKLMYSKTGITRLLLGKSSNYSDNFRFSYFAIGKWKQGGVSNEV